MENETQATRWPMDFDALKKGDVIPVADVEQMTGKKQGTKEYQFALLNMVKRMRDNLFHNEKFWTIAIRKDAICILNDVEASEYNPKEYETSRNRLKRLHVQCLAVDSMQLSDEQRDAHYRRLQVQAFEMSAMRTARLESIKTAKQIEATT
jgi:hypothetical protein